MKQASEQNCLPKTLVCMHRGCWKGWGMFWSTSAARHTPGCLKHYRSMLWLNLADSKMPQGHLPTPQRDRGEN